MKKIFICAILQPGKVLNLNILLLFFVYLPYKNDLNKL